MEDKKITTKGKYTLGDILFIVISIVILILVAVCFTYITLRYDNNNKKYLETPDTITLNGTVSAIYTYNNYYQYWDISLNDNTSWFMATSPTRPYILEVGDNITVTVFNGNILVASDIMINKKG